MAIGEDIADSKTVIEQAYAAFNRRDIDAALVLMTDDVSWPRASEGGRVIGKDEIRAYWTRQWAEFDPHVDPLAITQVEGARSASAFTSSSRACTAMCSRIAK